MTAMADAADLFPRTLTPRHGVQAVIVTPPASETDTLTIAWDTDGDDGDDEQVVEKDVRWASNGRLPATDDVAILFNDDRGDPFALVHATGDPFNPGAADVAALGVRVTALEDKPALGSDTVTFTASNTSAPKVIAHGLGVTPNVQLTPENANMVLRFTKDATNITVVGYHSTDAPISGTYGFDWRAEKP